jgi:hypothetical protein
MVAGGFRRRDLFVVALLWWAWTRTKEIGQTPGPWAGKLPYLPAEMLLDAVMGTAMLIGSTRARTIAL